MPKVTFILGLCGSGKSHLAAGIAAGAKFDEGFLLDEEQHQALFAALRSGEDCVVVEFAYVLAEERRKILAEIEGAVPGVDVEWLCIENHLARANKNCRERDKGDAEWHVRINEYYWPRYTYPEGSEVRAMWTKGA
jgi:hypothetical protein